MNAIHPGKDLPEVEEIVTALLAEKGRELMVVEYQGELFLRQIKNNGRSYAVLIYNGKVGTA